MDTRNGIILAVLMTSSLLNAGYFVPIFLTAFFGTPPAGEPVVTGSLERTPLIALMVVPLFVCGLISVLLGIYPDLLLRIVRLMGGG
jgi:multicomponent Na+:H+ antiporter subunit D